MADNIQKPANLSDCLLAVGLSETRLLGTVSDMKSVGYKHMALKTGGNLEFYPLVL